MENKQVKRVLMADLEDHVRCCFDSHILQDPYLLMCCHTYCMSCLPQLASKHGYVCRICQICTPPDQLRPSEFMSHMIEKCKNAKQDPECSHCDRNKSPDYKCRECQVFVCSDQCKTKHLRLHRNHSILAYSKATDEVVVNPVLFCTEHTDIRLEMNCTTCQRLICEQCSEKGHKSHEFSNLLAAGVEQALTEITPLKRTLAEMEHSFKAIKSAAEANMEVSNDSFDKGLHELQVYKDSLIAQIEREYTEIRRNIHNNQEELDNHYKRIIDEHKHKLTSVGRALKWSRLVEVHAENECLLQTLQSELIPQLKALNESLNPEQSPIRIRKPEDVILNMLTFDKPPDQQFFVETCRIEEINNTQVLYMHKVIRMPHLVVSPWKTVDLNRMILNNSDLSVGPDWEFTLRNDIKYFSLLVVNDRVLVPLNRHNTVLVLSLSGELLFTKTYPQNVQCRGLQKWTEAELILGTNNGLFLVDSESLDITENLYSKGDVGVGFRMDNDEIVALDATNNRLIILRFLGDRKVLETCVQLQGFGEIACGDSVVKSGSDVYIAQIASGFMYRYSTTGELLNHVNGERRLNVGNCRLLGVDGLGDVVFLNSSYTALNIVTHGLDPRVWSITGLEGSAVTAVHILDDTLLLVLYRGHDQPRTLCKYHLN